MPASAKKISPKTESKNTAAEGPRIFSVAESVFSMEEAARFMRVGRSLMFELVAARKIKTFKIGRRSLIRGCELKRFLDSLSE